ncbi:DUF3376 domain-containing protein [Streptomyces sp. CoH27]|uniref:DUF3376 domain-containing protein n=1 Tax=Streptomyces sp. CoH27 TaxID=2875763 RepID=UPI001CD6DA52|nr:DUF3376 domain-containing protein [Streptomyces sp. CoH27]
MAAQNDVAPTPQPETRLALVMNGGVSLAVWMGGVTHELDLLCRASSGVPEESVPDADRPAFRIWRSITRSAGRKVLVDIVAGTSAGGLNGLILGTALARGAELPDLRSVWEKSAALEALLEPKSPTSLLSGDSFKEKIDNVLQHIGERTSGAQQRQELTLFMTATALDGRSRSYTDGFRNPFDVRDHRRLYRFQYQPESVSYTKQGEDWGFRTEPLDEFGKDDTPALVLAARATAGFPAAFSPVNEAPLVKYRRIPKSGYDDPASCVVDGGVLNNAPFQPVLEAITKRRLNAPVDRVVVFIVPSAGRLGPESTAGLRCDEISWSKVLWNAVRYPQEADFRSSAEELCTQLGNSIRDTQLDLFARTGQDPALAQQLRSRAEELLPEFRRNRARAVLYDVRKQLADAETVISLAATPEADANRVEAILAGLQQGANWVPTTAGTEITDPYSGGVWRWGLLTCERALRCMSDHLHHRLAEASSPQRQQALISGAETISDLTRHVLAMFEAVDAQLQLRHPPGTDTSDETAARLVQDVFTDLRVPQQLARIVSAAGQIYVTALVEADLRGWQRSEDVVAAYLTVEVVTRAYAPLSKFVERLMPDFRLLRLGPDAISPLFNEDRFAGIGDRKLYGVRFQHFGAFFSAAWRRSDFAWGRLDAAHHLLSLFPLSAAQRRSRETELHDAILRAEAPEDGPRPREWMRGNLEELKQPQDNLLLKEVAATEAGARSLQGVLDAALALLRLPWWAQWLTRRTRQAAWRAYLDDPKAVKAQTVKAAVATLRSLVLVILAAGAVLGFMAIGLVGTAIALLTRL